MKPSPPTWSILPDPPLSSSAMRATACPADLAAKADAAITIPCPGPVESLNAAVAASVLLYEAAAAHSRCQSALRATPELRGARAMNRYEPASTDLPGRQSTRPRSPASHAWRPLAERMRPRTLDELCGQEHLVGPGKPLRVQIERDDASLDDLLGPARRGQNHAGQNRRRNHEGQLHRVLRRHERDQGDQAGHGRRRKKRPSCTRAPFSSSMKFTASTRRSRTRSCPTSSAEPSASSARPPRILPSKSSRRCSRAAASTCCSRLRRSSIVTLLQARA